MKGQVLLIIGLAILSYASGEDSNAETPPEITVAGIVYHIYSSSSYGETYPGATITAACPDNMQAVSAGCFCKRTYLDGGALPLSGVTAIEAQYVADNAAHCDCKHSSGGVVDLFINVQLATAYVTCAETVYNSGSEP